MQTPNNELVRIARVTQNKRLYDIRVETGIDEPRLSRYENGLLELTGDELTKIFKILDLDIKLLGKAK